MRRSPLLLPLLLLLGFWPAPLAAQQGAGVLLVSVRAADSGAPLPGAQVVVRGVGMGGSTDGRGMLRLSSLPSGAQVLEARYLGYSPQSVQVVVVPGQVANVMLDLPVRPIELAEVRVRARRSVLHGRGFYERKQSGLGTFISRDQIERMHPRFMSDVLRRVAGVSLQSTSLGGTSRASMRGNKVVGRCPIQYYLDGTMTAFYNIDEIRPEDVEGLEVYRGAATIPPAYNKGTALCGVILIWTRMQ